ncbi:MAG TPA: hypothetical protein VEG34_06255 [Thermoanaerobaculia bacterium]|nr:hypothetical protein [Thermoanaerobaculia bacterium]
MLDPGVELPEGVEVRVEVDSADPMENHTEDPLLRMVDLAVPTGIPDLATNIDHHLYGHPRADGG